MSLAVSGVICRTGYYGTVLESENCLLVTTLNISMHDNSDNDGSGEVLEDRTSDEALDNLVIIRSV